MFKKQMTHAIRKKITEYTKSKLDIAPLIKDVDIKGENLARSYISELAVPGEDISNTNFTGAKVKIIGNAAKAKNCRFIRTQFLPGSSFRGADLRGSNFYEANGAYIDYAYSDMRGANICGTVFSFASRFGRGAKVSRNIIQLLEKWWDIQDGPPMADIRID